MYGQGFNGEALGGFSAERILLGDVVLQTGERNAFECGGLLHNSGLASSGSDINEDDTEYHAADQTEGSESGGNVLALRGKFRNCGNAAVDGADAGSGAVTAGEAGRQFKAPYLVEGNGRAGLGHEEVHAKTDDHLYSKYAAHQPENAVGNTGGSLTGSRSDVVLAFEVGKGSRSEDGDNEDRRQGVHNGHIVRHLLCNCADAGENLHEDQSDDSADHRCRQEELLQNFDLAAQQQTNEQKHTCEAERNQNEFQGSSHNNTFFFIFLIRFFAY